MNEYIQKFDQCVSDYISDLTHTGKSEKTVKNYQKRLGYFREFWSKQNPASEPSTADVRAWRDSMLDNGTAASTVRQYLVELKTFFEFAAEDLGDGERYFQRNPVSKRLFPSTKGASSKPYEHVLDAEDLKKLWKNERIGRANRSLWARNYAIVTLLLDGKIRNAELLDLKLSDVHFATEDEPYNYVTIIKGKGNKYREVDLNEISASALLLYLKSGARPEEVSDDDYLFGTTAEKVFQGKSAGAAEWHRGTGSWLSDLVERHVQDVTGKSGFRSHSMRHNGAMLDLNTGARLEEIQSELGHASMSTTQIYAGKLMARRNRAGMKEAAEVRDLWAQRNLEMLQAK